MATRTQKIGGIDTRELVISALLISVVYVSTALVNIQLPMSLKGGLIHLGNPALFIAAIVFGKRHGAIAGAVGMTMFDMLSSWFIWAPGTFIIRGIMGLIVGHMAYMGDRDGEDVVWNVFATLLSGVWMIAGYYIYHVLVIMPGNWVVAATSIPGDIIQLVIGVIIGVPAAAALKKTKIYKVK